MLLRTPLWKWTFNLFGMLSLTSSALTSPSSSSFSCSSSGGVTEESGRSRRSPVRNAPQQPGQWGHASAESVDETVFSLWIRYRFSNVKYEHSMDDTYLYYLFCSVSKFASNLNYSLVFWLMCLAKVSDSTYFDTIFVSAACAICASSI